MPTKKTSQTKTTARKTTAKATTRGATATKGRSRARANGATVDGAVATASRRRGGPRELVIVESPAKARTIQGILGSGYEVTASVGHVRDLPKSKLGVDVDNDFLPQYIVPREKKAVVAKIREMASTASGIYLATDPDREGEAISWHLVEAAGLDGVPGRPMQRVVFHELT